MTENGSPPQDVNAQGRQAPAPKPRRLGLYLPFILLGVFAVGWTIVWFISAHAAGRIADGFIAREAERGRTWVCPDRSVGGYPFRIEISCDKPQFVLRRPNMPERQGSLGSLSMHARILSPGHFIAVMGSPLTAREAGSTAIEISWTSGRASVRAGLQSVYELSFDFADADFAIGPGDRQDIKALAKRIELHLRRSPGDKIGTDLVTRIDDLTFAPLDRLTGSPEPMRFELQMTAPGLVPDPKVPFQEIVEQWRLSGEVARVILLKATKGKANLDLSGTLTLDAERRPEGSLQGRAKGLDALTTRLGRRGGLDIGGLLGQISGGQGLPVALTLQDGLVRFGPFPIAELRPLY